MSSGYSVRISAPAERDLLRLPEKIGAACLEFIFGPLAEEPFRVGGPLSGHLTGLRSARRGSYRVIYAIDEERRRVDVTQPGQRAPAAAQTRWLASRRRPLRRFSR